MHTCLPLTLRPFFFTASLLLCTTVLSTETTAAVAGIDSLSVKRQQFIEKADSLDLVKQEYKRNALPVAELEQQQGVLRDSLRILRESIQNKVTTPSPTTYKRSSSSTKPRFPLPSNLFDWIIIIVGTIATFSGVLLVAGIVKKIRTTHKHAKTGKNSLAKAPPPPSASEKPVAEFPSYTVTGAKTGFTPPHRIPEPPQYQTDTATIMSLRQRIRTQPVSEEEVQVIPPPPPPVAPPMVHTTVPKNAKELSIEEKVLDAARKGTDVATISRTFHISSDHVTLILKVAKNK